MANWRNSTECPAGNANCPSDAALGDLLVGRLDGTDVADVEVVFGECAECAKRCERLKVTDDVVRALQGMRLPTSSAGDVAHMMGAVLPCSGNETAPTGGEFSHRERDTEFDGPAHSQATRPMTAPPESSSGNGVLSGESLVHAIERSGLLSEEQFATLQLEVQKQGKSDDVFRQLVSDGILTAWQLQQLQKGHTTFLLDNGRYVLLDMIGKGGMGAVYKARHVRMNREVALKVIRPKRGDTEPMVRRFQREVAVTSKLHHEHIVHAYDVGNEGEVAFLVLEYVHGSDLASLVKRDGSMAADEATAVCVQAASGLAYAHAKGIVHRDIKPQNILLSTNGITKILDMGLARIDDAEVDGSTALTQEGAVMGTIDYMAPEQGADAHRSEPRSDVYSLGATLYYLLSGKSPYPGGTAVDKLRRLTTEDPQPLGQLRPDLPRELTAVVETMMAKDPAQRYQTMEDVVRALQPFAADTIAGRAVVTASVRSAAETIRSAGDSTESDSTPSFAFDSGGSISTILRRKFGSGSQRMPWILGGAVAVAVLIGLLTWAIGRNVGTNAPNDPGGFGEEPPPVSLSKQPPKAIKVLRTGQYGSIQANLPHVAWSTDGLRFATSSTDGDIRVWDTLKCRLVSVYQGHFDVRDMEWSPDDKRIGSLDNRTGELHVWDAATGRQQYRVSLTQKIQAFAFLPNGKELVLSGAFGTGRWNIAQKRMRVLITQEHYDTLRISPGGRWLATSLHGRNSILLWDLSQLTKEPVNTTTLPRFSQQRSWPAFWRLLDEKRFIVVSDGKAQLRNAQTSRLEKELKLPQWGEEASGTWLSPNGHWVLVANNQGFHRVDLLTGKTVTSPFPEGNSPLFGARGGLMSPAGSHWYGFIGTPGMMRPVVLNIDSGRHEPVNRPNLIPTHRAVLLGGRYLCSSWSTDGAAYSGWDLQSGQTLDALKHDWIRNRLFPYVTDEGDWLYCYRTQILQTQPANFGSLLRVVSDPEGFAKVPDGLQLARAGFLQDGQRFWAWHRPSQSTGPQRSLIRQWDTKTGKLLKSWAFPPMVGVANAVVANPHGSNFAIGREIGNGYEIELLREGQSQPLRIPVAVRDLTKKYEYAHRHEKAVRLVLSANDRRLAAVNIRPDNVIIWNTENGKRTAAFSLPDEVVDQIDKDRFPYQLSARGRYFLLQDAIWDVEASPPKVVWKVNQTYAWQHYFAVLFGDERHILVRVRDQIQVWDWKANKKRMTIYLLPDMQWLLWNHETRHYRGSMFAHLYVRFTDKDDPRQYDWVTPLRYQRHTGWKNDPGNAGLNLPGLKKQ